ncbi:hypothetical protein BpHYR1_017256 [Brachionus plicatilis]|uniref:Uncharacterized protein n=1 Tax=Brachionus plicatilis TaxID=10195 RepID=A0A3M7P6H7_BRAPC|nr:hypothetical protein BpHYR1_017256 [Brachionus plicatilis]
MESNQDDMLNNMIFFNKHSVDSLGSRIRDLKTETCFVRKKICQVENCKKAADLSQRELDSKLRNKMEMAKKIDQLNKINYILKFELDQVEHTKNSFIDELIFSLIEKFPMYANF